METFAVPTDSNGAVCAVALGGAAALALSAPLTWGSLRVATTGAGGSVTDAPVVFATLALAVIAIVAGTLLVLFGWERGAQLAGWVAAAVATVVGLFTFGAELVASLLPLEQVPLVARHLTASAGPGPGAWIALLGALAVVAASFERTRDYARDAADAVLARGRACAALLAALALAAAALVQLRQDPWLTTPVDHGGFALEGVAVPGFGAGALLAVCLLVGGIALALRDYWGWGARLAIAAGVVAAATAALLIACADAVAILGLHHWDAQPAAWATLGLGVIVVALGTLLLLIPDEPDPSLFDDPLFAEPEPPYDLLASVRGRS